MQLLLKLVLRNYVFPADTPPMLTAVQLVFVNDHLWNTTDLITINIYLSLEFGFQYLKNFD